MSVTTEMMSAPAARTPPARSTVMPPMATSGRGPIRRFHSVTLSSPCSFHFMALRIVGYTGAERHVVGIERQTALEFGVVMGADAEPEARLADCRDVGRIEVLLPEMDEVAAGVDGGLPVVVDDENRAVPGAEFPRPDDLPANLVGGSLLDPELDQLHAQRQRAPEPVRVVEDRVEPVESHARKAFPMTGVDGAAMSRASMGSAAAAAAPASTDFAKAPAIATGSPARATAELTRTAS